MDVRSAVARRIPPSWRRSLIRAEFDLVHRFARSPAARIARPLVRPLLIRDYLRRPEEVDIEVTSSCDADCIMCPRRSMRRAAGPMDLDLFRKIVDEAVALDVRDLVLNGYGEIATLRNYADYLGYIRARSRRIRILTNTNGMRMTEDMARCLVDMEVDVLNVAIDGATPATYESIRKHLKLEVVEENVLRLMDVRRRSGRKRPYVMVQMIAMPENAGEADRFIAKWTGKVDYTGIAGLVSRAGSVAGGRPSEHWSRIPCFLLWRQMPVLSDGSVAMCCDDWDGQRSYGNLRTGHMAEIWRSHARRQVRALHESGRMSEIDLCQACRSPRVPPWWF